MQECFTEVALLPEIAKLYTVTAYNLFHESFGAYQSYAQRLLAVYEASGKPENFRTAKNEFHELPDSVNRNADDLRSCGVLYQYLINHADEKAMEYCDAVPARENNDKVYTAHGSKSFGDLTVKRQPDIYPN